MVKCDWLPLSLKFIKFIIKIKIYFYYYHFFVFLNKKKNIRNCFGTVKEKRKKQVFENGTIVRFNTFGALSRHFRQSLLKTN